MDKEKEKIKALKALQETQKEIREKIITLMASAFGLVAALAWNEAVKGLFETYFKKGNGLWGKFIYAAIVTTLVVVITLQLKRFAPKKE